MLANVAITLFILAWAVGAALYVVRRMRDAAANQAPACIGCSQKCSKCCRCKH
ncbi:MULTISPECIES: hypothetical protein [Fibrobacter]|uniref:hypothetical protein n=1 Tax=Fibrobacter TaxID=832 RepID=UPI000BDD5C45|nr:MULTISPECIES: hypothetical protein [Fibrobacter]MDD7300101.1 hypothetical protein [Fibrobacter intestinalis]PBC66505.1 hypothetical protein BGX14_2128 [Fibrobacter sp. UWS1]